MEQMIVLSRIQLAHETAVDTCTPSWYFCFLVSVGCAKSTFRSQGGCHKAASSCQTCCNHSSTDCDTFAIHRCQRSTFWRFVLPGQRYSVQARPCYPAFPGLCASVYCVYCANWIPLLNREEKSLIGSAEERTDAADMCCCTISKCKRKCSFSTNNGR